MTGPGDTWGPDEPLEEPVELRSVDPDAAPPVESLGDPPAEEEGPTDAEQREAVIQACWSLAALCETATRALERWAMTLQPVQVVDPDAAPDPEPWRCPACGGRVMQLGDGRYGCARTHAPVYATPEDMSAEREYNREASTRRRP